MINKLIKWAANKRGFILEDRNRLVLVCQEKGITCIRLATAVTDGEAIRIGSLEGMCISPGDKLKVYITK